MTPLENFTADMRRILYLQELLMFSLDGIRTNELCPAWYRTLAAGQMNNIRAMRQAQKVKDGGHYWKTIQTDLSSDRIHDLALHMDFISGINNVGEITKVLEENVFINEQ